MNHATAAAGADVQVVRAGPAEQPSAWTPGGPAAGRHLAHAAPWLEAIRRAYGHEPLYLTGEASDGSRGVLPAFLVRRPLAGAVACSMPFLDGGGPCASSPAMADALVAALVAEARRAGARSVDVRSSLPLRLAGEPARHKVNLVLALPAGEERLWRQLDGRVRNQVRKAQRSGLSVEFGGADKLGDFYPVFAARMRELGSPVHGLRFFAEVFAAFGREARLGLVRRGPEPLGGLVALGAGDTLTVPWAACRREHAALCPNMLLYWETLRLACAEGYRRFDFGRSTRGSGTHRFKRQWGAVEEPLFWYTLPAGRPASLSAGRRAAAAFARSWRRLPPALTHTLGPRLRRYLTQ